MKGNGQETAVNQTKSSLLVMIFRYVAPLVILALGVFVLMHLMNTSPKAKPGGKKQKQQTIVRVEPVSFSSHTTAVIAMGNVIASKEIDIKPRISGEVIEISPSLVPGGYFKKDQEILKVDATDYEIELLELQTDLAAAESALEIEMGSQRIARKEYALLGEEATEAEKRLMLRSPQLLQQQAAVQAAEARVKKGELNVRRTRITAPFNAVVIERSANIGALVSTTSTLATIAGTDTFWVQLAVPVEKLKWIKLPGHTGAKGSVVKVYTGKSNDDYRLGHVVRVAADLEALGRMAQLYVEVEDPLCLLDENSGKTPLFLGSYVQAEITGEEIDGVVYLSRSQLKDNNTVWLYGDDGALVKRTVEVLFRGDEFVLVRGLEQGESLIVSSIAAPVEGMLLIQEKNLQKGGKLGEAGAGKQSKGGSGNGK